MAAITGYTTLLTTVQDYLARSNLSTFAENFIQNWEERFYRQPKNFGSWMEVTGTIGTIASNVVVVPTRYLRLKNAYVDGNPSTRLDRKSIHQLYGRYPRGSDTDRPKEIARDGINFVFGPPPDSTYTIKGTYYAKPVVMRLYPSDASGHWLIMNAPDLPLYGALLEAESFIKNDPRIALWQSFYTPALQDYRDLFSEEEVSGGPVQEVLG